MATQKKIIGKLPVFRGEYNKDVVYYKHNIVTYLGSSFISTKDENMSAPCTVGDKEFILSSGWGFFSDSSEAYFMDERFDEMAEVTVTTDDEDEVNDVESDIVNEALRKTPQTLSKAEQAQARTNIGAASLEENEAFKTEVEEQVVSIDAKVSDIGSKIILLKGMYDSPSMINTLLLGEFYYNTSTKKIYKCVDEVNHLFVSIPFAEGAIYTIDDDLFLWDGNDLILQKSVNDLKKAVSELSDKTEKALKKKIERKGSLLYSSKGSKNYNPRIEGLTNAFVETDNNHYMVSAGQVVSIIGACQSDESGNSIFSSMDIVLAELDDKFSVIKRHYTDKCITVGEGTAYVDAFILVNQNPTNYTQSVNLIYEYDIYDGNALMIEDDIRIEAKQIDNLNASNVDGLDDFVRDTIAESEALHKKKVKKVSKNEMLFNHTLEKSYTSVVGGLINAVWETDNVAHAIEGGEVYYLKGMFTFGGNISDETFSKFKFYIQEYDKDNNLIDSNEFYKESPIVFNKKSASAKIKVRFSQKAIESSTTGTVAIKWELYSTKEYISETVDDISFTNIQDVNGVNNGVSYLQNNIITWNGLYQFIVFADSDKLIKIGRRVLGECNSEWEFSSLPVIGNVKADGHYTTTIAVDEQGYIHVSGNMHVGNLIYTRSRYPFDIYSFDQGKLSMTAIQEDRVSYPMFATKADGGILFFYRDGDNIISVNAYDVSNKSWLKLKNTLLQGDGVTPYINHIAVANDGSIHISGCWRSGSNEDIYYIKSNNNGSTWCKSDGTAYELPITRNNSEVLSVIRDEGLLNQNGMCCDDNNMPHIAYFKNDENGYTQLHHLYQSMDGWKDVVVSDFSYSIDKNLTSYYSQLSRPSIFCYDGRTYILYRHNYTINSGRLMVLDVTNDDVRSECRLLDFPLYEYEPTYDDLALKERGELHLLAVGTTTRINESMPEDIRYKYWDNWKRQPAVVVSLDLSKMRNLMSCHYRLPNMNMVDCGKFVVANGAGNAYVKCSSLVDGDVKIVAKNINTEEVSTIGIVNKTTPYIPLSLDKKEEYIIQSEADGNVNISLSELLL